jgi:hypothetical protein
MSYTTTILAPMKLYFFLAPYIEVSVALELHFFRLVICPENSIAATDGALTFVEGFAGRRESNADCFAVAGCCEGCLLGIVHLHYTASMDAGIAPRKRDIRFGQLPARRSYNTSRLKV